MPNGSTGEKRSATIANAGPSDSIAGSDPEREIVNPIQSRNIRKGGLTRGKVPAAKRNRNTAEPAIEASWNNSPPVPNQSRPNPSVIRAAIVLPQSPQ